ncbi:MAG TPA: hypothetical protein VKP30_18970 [Polyangiaceae bacterium]|nr:hypothetical protein [Polyangiaceae bacterium]
MTPAAAFGQTNEAIAESLFLEGKQLYSEKKYEFACTKLAQSHKADPAGGTVMLLAMCYEQLGRTASAWAKYGEALALARRDGRQDRAQKAQESIEALAPQLTYANVTLEDAASKQIPMEFVLDEVPIPLLIDAKVPIDPGPHRLLVRAKGYEAWSCDFEITPLIPVLTITVPMLKREPVEPSSTALSQSRSAEPRTAQSGQFVAATSPEPSSYSTTRTLGWVIGGAGLVSLGVGTYFAVHASRLSDKANATCPASECADRDAVAWNDDARRSANMSTWFVGAGAAALVAGGAMVVFGGHSEGSLSAGAFVLPHGGTLSFRGTY